MSEFCFYIVGCGGTGSLLARDLPQLLLVHPDSHMVLIDGDVVERKNLKRQRFQEQEIGMNKAIALANKINTFYPVKCEAVDHFLSDGDLQREIDKRTGIPVIVGCVDNDATRKILEKEFRKMPTAVYIDSANSAYSGNVFTCIRHGGKEQGITRGKAKVLSKGDRNPADMSCTERAAAGELQYFVTNARMAVAVLEQIFNLITTGDPVIVGVTKLDRFTQIHY